MSKASEVIILAEDRRQKNLSLGFLKRWGYRSGRIRVLPLPAGAGAGEQYVREHYPMQLEALRRQREITAKALIVLIDADRRTTAETRNRLDAQARRHGLAAVTPGEPVCRFIPRRQIETWVVCLRGEPANEDDDYKARVQDAEPQSAGHDFGHQILAGSNPPASWVQSLRDAIPEALRVPRE